MPNITARSGFAARRTTCSGSAGLLHDGVRPLLVQRLAHGDVVVCFELWARPMGALCDICVIFPPCGAQAHRQWRVRDAMWPPLGRHLSIFTAVRRHAVTTSGWLPTVNASRQSVGSRVPLFSSSDVTTVSLSISLGPVDQGLHIAQC